MRNVQTRRADRAQKQKDVMSYIEPDMLPYEVLELVGEPEVRRDEFDHVSRRGEKSWRYANVWVVFTTQLPRRVECISKSARWCLIGDSIKGNGFDPTKH